MRICPHCQCPLSRPDFLRDRSRDMEFERRAQGLKGLRFRYYVCHRCGYDDVFVDVIALPGEGRPAFERRKRSLEKVVRRLDAERTEVVVSAGGEHSA